jgi:hypothetical protein
MEQIKLDEQKLQEMAQQYAMQGAEKAIRDFYTGYDSPFMNAIQRELKEKMETNLFFELSQMTAAINQALNDKVSEMANTVVANTFLPMLNRMFSQEKKTVVTTQDLYEHFGDAMKEDLDDEFDPERMELEIKDSPSSYSDHKYLYFIYDGDTKFELSLMDNRDPGTDDHGNTLYMITSLPGCSQYRADYYPRERQMRIRLKDGATLEMPFVPDVLRDEFMRYVAGLLLTNTLVTVKSCHEYQLEED